MNAIIRDTVGFFRIRKSSGAAMYEFDEEPDFGSDTTSKEARKPSRILSSVITYSPVTSDFFLVCYCDFFV